MVERIKNARPMMDLMAKKVFSNTEITAQFIRDILDLPVHHVKILDGTQIHDHQFEDIKAYVTSIDVLAELNDRSQVIIEIQVASQYNHKPEKILEQADRIVKRIDWTKEERKMYDERTRYMQAYLGHLAYLKQGLERGIEEGIQQGIQQGVEQGIEQGKISTIIDLVKNGVISKAIGLQQLNISEELFESYF